LGAYTIPARVESYR